MKKLLLSAAFIGFVAMISANAQEVTKSTKGSFQKNVVLEVYTSESCPACPGGKKRIEDAIASLGTEYQSRVFQASVHTKFYGDGIVSTWPRVQTLASALSGMLGFGYLPSLTINRTEKKATNQSEQQALAVPSSAQIKNKIMQAFGDGTAKAEVALSLTQGATANDNCTATVKGKLDADILNEPLLLTMYVLKNNMEPILPPAEGEPSGQAGASANYLHQHTVLMILTNDVKGDAFEVAADGTFTVTKEFKLDGFDIKDTNILAFVHHPMADTDHSIINAGQASLANAPTSITEVATASTIKAYALNGKIITDGDYSKMEIFNMNGQVVNNDSLIPGVYIARIVANNVIHFVKVNVQ